MAKVREKQTHEMSVSPTLIINRETAEKAIAAIFPKMRIHSSDVYWKTGEQYTLTATLWDKYWDKDVTHTNPPKSVKVVVSWPEGQEGHGIAEVTWPSDLGIVESHGHASQKFACWKNEKGEVEIAKWTQPPRSHHQNLQCLDKYGVKWPRNKKLIDGYSYVVSYFFTPFLCFCVGFIVLGTPAMLLLINLLDIAAFVSDELSYQIIFLWVLTGGVPGAVVGGVLGHINFVQDLNLVLHDAWVEEEKKDAEIRKHH